MAASSSSHGHLSGLGRPRAGLSNIGLPRIDPMVRSPQQQTRADYALQVGPLQITGYVDRAVGRSFMDIGFRFGNAILPLYRSEPPGQILILPDILSAGNPGAAMTEPSISALLSPTNQSPVRGRITGTVIRRPVQQVPGGPVTNELWFCVAYDFTVRQPLSSNSRQGTTSYGPEQRYYDAVYAVRLPNL